MFNTVAILEFNMAGTGYSE